MRVLWAVMIAAIAGLATTAVTNAPLREVERTGTITITVGTWSPPPPDVPPASAHDAPMDVATVTCGDDADSNGCDATIGG